MCYNISVGKESSERRPRVAGTKGDRSVYEGVVQKGNTLRIHVAGMIVKEQPYLDIRTYYLTDDDEWAPTKKGVRVHAEMGPDLLTYVQEALEAIDEEVAVGVKK